MLVWLVSTAVSSETQVCVLQVCVIILVMCFIWGQINLA